MKKLPTASEVSEFVLYNAETGFFHWKVDRLHVVKAGDVAGKTDPKGYRIIKIQGQAHRAHRLAWLLVKHDSQKKSQRTRLASMKQKFTSGIL